MSNFTGLLGCSTDPHLFSVCMVCVCIHQSMCNCMHGCLWRPKASIKCATLFLRFISIYAYVYWCECMLGTRPGSESSLQPPLYFLRRVLPFPTFSLSLELTQLDCSSCLHLPTTARLRFSTGAEGHLRYSCSHSDQHLGNWAIP